MTGRQPQRPVEHPRELLRGLFDAAVRAAQPSACLSGFLPAPPVGRTVVVGAGKASAAMAQALERDWPGALEGTVVTRSGYVVPCRSIEILEAAHPVPDAASVRAAGRILQRVRGLTEDDLVIALISGGGSSLMAMPPPGIALEEKRLIVRRLLACSASISEINCVRRHLSMIKGGRLAAACHPARVEALLISDVPGDDARDVASGPTVADASTGADALDVLRRYGVDVSDAARAWLTSAEGDTLKPGDPRLARVRNTWVATPQMALQAAAAAARSRGLNAVVLGDSIEGEAREVAKVMAAIAQQALHHGQPCKPPCVLLSGGETTVNVRGNGCGGRNVEFLLALGIALAGQRGIHALSADTDGVDGAVDIAGAYLSPDSLGRAAAAGIDPRKSLDDNDGHGFFGALGDSVITGPTLTNVNDFRALLVDSTI